METMKKLNKNINNLIQKYFPPEGNYEKGINDNNFKKMEEQPRYNKIKHFEDKKLQKQRKYQNWQDEQQSLKAKHPTPSRTWYAHKISRMSIAQGSDSETIRKHLKQ